MSELNKMIRHRSAKIPDRYTEIWKDLADNKYANKRILSYGCGLGEECFSLSKHFPQSTIKGVDIQKNTIDRAISKNKNPNISFEVSDYDRLLKDDSYDMIFAMNVFKIIRISVEELHIRYPLHVFDNQINDLLNLLNHNGLFIIAGSSYAIEDTSLYNKILIPVECVSNSIWKQKKGRNCVFKKI